jgi:hypothetical protein
VLSTTLAFAVILSLPDKETMKYYREDTTALLIELTDPPPAEEYTIELTSK